MATKAASLTKVTLQDGTELVLRPLNIRLFREFQERWTTMLEDTNAESTVLDQVDSLIDLAVICVSRELGDRAEDRDWLEDAFDFETIYLILKDCADVDLKPTNAMNTALAAVQNGQTSI
jgi:hypothetical protein